MLTLLDLPENSFPSLILVGCWLYALHYLRRSGYAVAFFGFFATAMHEACHYIVGLLLNAKPVSVSLWPRRQGNSWILGSVGFTHITLWNAAFVGLAPLLMLPLAWGLFTYWMLAAYAAQWYISWLVSGYFIACCLFGGWPSSTDIKVAFASASLYGAAVWCAYHFFAN